MSAALRVYRQKVKYKSDFIYMCRCILIKSVKLREAKTNAHFFCAGRTSDMADQNLGAMDP